MDLFLDFESAPARPPAMLSGYVFVSSLSMRTYKKSPLLRRWCELREDGVLSFFRDPSDLEPTKRIHLRFARVVVARGPRLTSSQWGQLDAASVAFYIDFPHAPRAHPLVETRFTSVLRMMSLSAGDSPKSKGVVASGGVPASTPLASTFPLGFIMVSPDGSQWQQHLLSLCGTPVPRDRKLARAKRWVARTWMKLRGHLSEAQFDEEMGSDADEGRHGENYFSVKETAWDEKSFASATDNESEDDDDEEDRVEMGALGKSPKASPKAAMNKLGGTFSSLAEMFATKDESVRHRTPISEPEILDVVRFVSDSKKFTTEGPPEGWSLCSEGEGFDCFKAVDETSGLLRTRTWAKIPDIPPHTLFHILYDPEARKAWDHHYSVFEKVAGGDAKRLDIINAVVTAPIGCANRQFLEWRRCLCKPAAGEFTIYLRSWEPENPAEAPLPKKTVRAEVWLSGYVISWWRDEQGAPLGSEVLVMTQIDIKGLIPKYIVNALASSTPRKWVKGVTAAAAAEMDQRGITMTTPDLGTVYGGVFHN